VFLTYSNQFRFIQIYIGLYIVISIFVHSFSQPGLPEGFLFFLTRDPPGYVAKVFPQHVEAGFASVETQFPEDRTSPSVIPLRNKTNPCTCTSVCLRTVHAQYTNRCALMRTAENVIKRTVHKHMPTVHKSSGWRHTG
jgi:hypothetical protein